MNPPYVHAKFQRPLVDGHIALIKAEDSVESSLLGVRLNTALFAWEASGVAFPLDTLSSLFSRLIELDWSLNLYRCCPAPMHGMWSRVHREQVGFARSH